MHLILLVWKNSRYYNTPTRLVHIMREICNALIKQATNFVDGETIFDLIENEQAHKALDMLQLTFKVCGQFKTRYFDYKAKANHECAKNPWRIQNQALFARLDTFLERCKDVLELTEVVVQFKKLEKVEVGGIKGKTLTTSVQQIFSDFEGQVTKLKSVQYDVMDVDNKQFDDDIY